MAFSLTKILSGLKPQKREAAPTATVGIDIGDASVKVIEIEQTDKALMLRTYGELQLGPYDSKPLGEVVSLDNKRRIEAVTDVMREAGVNSRHGALAMPLSSSFMTVVPIRANEDEDISSRVPVEARKYVPLPITDVTLDWTELQQVDKERTNTREVMLAAIENQALSDYRELLNVISMTGEPAEIEAFSLVRSLWKRSDTTLAIIDIGARTSKLYIVRDGNLERLHRVTGGGLHITKHCSESLGVPFDEAENLKRSYDRGSDQGQKIYKAMVTVMESPLSEFKRLISQYEARVGAPIGRVVFSGGVAASPHFLAYARDTLGKAAEIGDPFSKVAYPAFMEDTLKDIAPIFGVSLGAALRRFQYE